MIYVDDAKWTKGKSGRKLYAHMIADSLEELHKFASSIGIKPHFFHRSKFLHYDITAEQREIAIRNGAIALTSRELVKILRKAVTN